MRMIAKIAVALGFAGATALAVTAPAQAQVYFNAPGVHIGIGPPHRQYSGPRYYDYYPGPGGGDGWNTWNGCPPAYTIQDGVCKPYRGY